MSDLQGGVKVPLLVPSSVALVSPDIGVSVAAVWAVPGFDNKIMMMIMIQQYSTFIHLYVQLYTVEDDDDDNDPTIFHIHSFICTL